MSEAKISELPVAEKVNSEDLIMIIQNGANKQVTADKVLKKDGKTYGIKRQVTPDNSNPAWTRIEDAVGLIANATKDGSAVQNDFDNIYPWNEIITYNYDVQAKKITAFYGEPTFKFDGSNGEVLTRIPEFWYKREVKSEPDGNTYEYMYIADYEAEGYIKSEQFSVGRYTNSGSSSRVTSKSGVAPFTNYTRANARNYCKALGFEFCQMDWHYLLLEMLYLVEYANYNSQAMLGKGYTDPANTAAINSGGCDSLGMRSGCTADDSLHSMIYRGMENIFGNIWQFIDGINIQNYQAYICYDSTKYADDKYNDGYRAIGYVNSDADNVYAKRMGYDPNNPLVAFAIEVGGSNATYVTDTHHSAAAGTIASVGGSWRHRFACWLLLVVFHRCFFYCAHEHRLSPS